MYLFSSKLKRINKITEEINISSSVYGLSQSNNLYCCDSNALYKINEHNIIQYNISNITKLSVIEKRPFYKNTEDDGVWVYKNDGTLYHFDKDLNIVSVITNVPTNIAHIFSFSNGGVAVYLPTGKLRLYPPYEGEYSQPLFIYDFATSFYPGKNGPFYLSVFSSSMAKVVYGRVFVTIQNMVFVLDIGENFDVLLFKYLIEPLSSFVNSEEYAFSNIAIRDIDADFYNFYCLLYSEVTFNPEDSDPDAPIPYIYCNKYSGKELVDYFSTDNIDIIKLSVPKNINSALFGLLENKSILDSSSSSLSSQSSSSRSSSSSSSSSYGDETSSSSSEENYFNQDVYYVSGFDSMTFPVNALPSSANEWDGGLKYETSDSIHNVYEYLRIKEDEYPNVILNDYSILDCSLNGYAVDSKNTGIIVDNGFTHLKIYGFEASSESEEFNENILIWSGIKVGETGEGVYNRVSGYDTTTTLSVVKIIYKGY